MLTLKEARISQRRTVTEMAELMNVTRQTYHAWEKQPNRVSVPQAKKLCDYLGYSLDDIFFGGDVNES